MCKHIWWEANDSYGAELVFVGAISLTLVQLCLMSVCRASKQFAVIWWHVMHLIWSFSECNADVDDGSSWQGLSARINTDPIIGRKAVQRLRKKTQLLKALLVFSRVSTTRWCLILVTVQKQAEQQHIYGLVPTKRLPKKGIWAVVTPPATPPHSAIPND
jgi:hypothetical protein